MFWENERLGPIKTILPLREPVLKIVYSCGASPQVSFDDNLFLEYLPIDNLTSKSPIFPVSAFM